MPHIGKNFIKDYLAACGVEDTQKYLYPTIDFLDNVWGYENIRQGVETLKKHINNRGKICIIADVDIDGNCSAAMQYLFLKSHGVEPLILYHTGKQHGLGDVLDKVLEYKPDLVWIADAGSNDRQECNTLYENKIDVLITDHHIIEKDNPHAVIINNQIGNHNKMLSGCGVTYNLIRAYSEQYNESCFDMWDLVAVSIIGDVCSLLPLENRWIVHYGLSHPQNEFLKLLFAKCTRYGITPKGIAWEVAPLCNALARSDEQKYKNLFVDALIGNVDGESALTEMRRIKRNQDKLTAEIVGGIERNLDTNHKAVIAFMDNEHKTYSGLIAGKLCGKYNKPSFVLRELDNTTWSGSMRSPVDLLETINESALANCQGHDAACGVLIKKANLRKFAKFIDSLDLSRETVYEVAATLNEKDITLRLCEEIAKYSSLWGKDIAEPLFHIVLENPSIFIFRKATNTLRLEQNGVSFIKFRLPDQECRRFENLSDKTVELICRVQINEYNDQKVPQAIIEEYEIVDKPKEEFDFDKIFQ